MASHFVYSSLAITLLSLLFSLVSSGLLLEDGYTVTTVIDGHQLEINPHSVIDRPGSSDLIVLDSSRSAFYTLSFPLSEESVFKRLAGDGVQGYSDGEPGSARFDKPKSFAVDMKGNIYVADKSNHCLCLAADMSLGVTTIAGGGSKKEGRADGPAQNASFSNDFELTFVPHICALLISDHGNQLIRQINLKPEDCSKSSQSGSALGAVSVWVLVSVLSCLVSLVIGFVARPYIIRHEGWILHFSMTWRHYLINLVRLVRTCCYDIRSVTASPTLYALVKRVFWLSLSHLSLMFRINNLKSRTPKKDVVSLLDSSDLHGCEIKKSHKYADQLKDLLSFDGNQDLITEVIFRQELENQKSSDVLCLPNSHGMLDDMIRASIMGFDGEAKETTTEVGSLVGNSGLGFDGEAKETTTEVGSLVGNSGLVKRRK
ncbi:NHL domain-containing protein [Citrus sinensis]|uniref:NHL domain-containing protein n=1 Tax=Citrus sinensis TaxID=2711 RepID=A0ACB8LJA9_CITSI|nr:NHL domain-containing protein [Citrus sinensis]